MVKTQANVIIGGEVSGDLLHSHEPLSFWGGYDPQSGEIIDRRHPLSGKIGASKILAIPFTRGSSTTTSVLLESVRAGVAPLAIIATQVDTFFALASIVADEMYQKPIPLFQVSETSFEALVACSSVQISNNGAIEGK